MDHILIGGREIDSSNALWIWFKRGRLIAWERDREGKLLLEYHFTRRRKILEQEMQSITTAIYGD